MTATVGAIIRTITACWLASPLAGCSTRDPDRPFDPAQAEPVAEAEFCAKYAAAVCGWVVPCCASLYAIDAAACSASVRTDCEKTMLPHAAGTTFDPKIAGVCVAMTAASITNCRENDDPAAGRVQLSCLFVWHGPVAAGGACTDSVQCVPAPNGTRMTECVPAGPGTTMGVCTPWTFANVGEACSSTFDCVSTAYCAFDATTMKGTCVARAGKGAACDRSAPGACADRLTCDAATSTCVDPLGLGEPCLPGVSTCVPTARCYSDTKTCIVNDLRVSADTCAQLRSRP